MEVVVVGADVSADFHKDIKSIVDEPSGDDYLKVVATEDEARVTWPPYATSIVKRTAEEAIEEFFVARMDLFFFTDISREPRHPCRYGMGKTVTIKHDKYIIKPSKVKGLRTYYTGFSKKCTGIPQDCVCAECGKEEDELSCHGYCQTCMDKAHKRGVCSGCYRILDEDGFCHTLPHYELNFFSPLPMVKVKKRCPHPTPFIRGCMSCGDYYTKVAEAQVHFKLEACGPCVVRAIQDGLCDVCS